MTARKTSSPKATIVSSPKSGSKLMSATPAAKTQPKNVGKPVSADNIVSLTDIVDTTITEVSDSSVKPTSATTRKPKTKNPKVPATAPAAPVSQSQPVLSPKEMTNAEVISAINNTILNAKPQPAKPSRSRRGPKLLSTGPVVITSETTHANGAALSSKRPGVLAALVQYLTAASKTAPVTKTQILDLLVTLFPERAREKMKATVSMQVPAGLRTEKKIILDSVKVGEGENAEKGYWIDAKATAEYRKA